MEMLELMKDTEREVFHSMMGSYDSLTLWKPWMNKQGIDYYVDENVGKGLTRFCCVGHTDAPVTDMMEMFLVTNTKTLLKNVRIMYRNVKEAKILSVVQPATKSNPHRSVYIRYTSFDTPNPMKGRDICVCVCTDLVKMEDGSTVGYCLWESVDLPECPDRFSSDKIIRSRMWQSGFLFRNSGGENAVTKVCYLIGAEIKGFAPQFFGRICMPKFGGNCRRVCQHFRKQKLDPETFVPRADWDLKQKIRACRWCQRGFNPLVNKYNCVSCGVVVCSRCFFMTEVSVPGAVVTRVRICHVCLTKAGMKLKSRSTVHVVRGSLDSLNSDESGVRDLLRD
ncbi:hypothetical protein P3T76_009062 [Phytophthora citrophthora]|uniref:FYVE-type domain-containing protein n=1 Tax=Phytophthora citrophthora TaxID=4793 RepID=A0AAD9GIG3_9STRA|nr:hypothetical protein P3T76_009062 [Phytophthora citrophthora]